MSINQNNKTQTPTTTTTTTTTLGPHSRPSIILARDPITETYATNSRHDRFQRKITHYTMVNECNYQTQYYLKSRASVKREVIRHLEEAPNVIHPFSILRKWWEIIMIVVLFFAFIVIPYHASFIYDFNEKYGIATIVLNIISECCVLIYLIIWLIFSDKSKTLQYILEISEFSSILSHKIFYTLIYFTGIFCFLDIVLNFCTGYYDKDRSCIILNMGKICKRYLSTYFIIDIISVIPLPGIVSITFHV